MFQAVRLALVRSLIIILFILNSSSVVASPQVQTLALTFGSYPSSMGNYTTNGIFEAQYAGRILCEFYNLPEIRDAWWIARPTICDYLNVTVLTVNGNVGFFNFVTKSTDFKILQIDMNVLFVPKNTALGGYQICASGSSEVCITAQDSGSFQFHADPGASDGISYFMASTGNDGFAVTSLVLTYTTTTVDLSIGPISVSQTGATIGSDGIITVAPNKLVQVTVPVNGSKFNSPENRATTVTLQAGQQALQSKTISLTDMQSGTVKAAIFDVTFDQSLAGTTQTITATINPGNILDESNFSDNTKSVQVKVAAPYKLVVRPLDGTVVQSGPPQEVEVAPSVYACGRATADVRRQARIQVTCVDESSGELKEGCSFQAHLEEGPDDGGHDRSHSGRRPFGKIVSASATALSPIPLTGTTVQFETPDAAGSVDYVVEGKSPTGTDLKPVTVRYRVKTSGFELITASGLTIDVASHPNGVYGTSLMNQKLGEVVQFYVENAQASEIDDPPGLRSEGATLPWGGLFDIGRSWHTPHCGHRDGKTLDLSMSVFAGYSEPTRQALKTALSKAIATAGFAFTYAPESPSSPSTDHWHIQLK